MCLNNIFILHINVTDIFLQTERPNEQPPDYETIGFNEKLGSGDLRIHYLDVLHSVQDLLDHYEEMSDEEKVGLPKTAYDWPGGRVVSGPDCYTKSRGSDSHPVQLTFLWWVRLFFWVRV